MEVAGLVLGVAGLAGLFSTCLDLMDKVVAARDAREDYEAAFSDYRACKMLFEEWGNSVDFYSGEPRDPEKRKAVYHVLASMEQLFTNASRLQNRYGVGVPTKEEASDKSKSSISLVKRARWAVRDKQKFADLTAMVATFTERLRQLVPIVDRDNPEMQEALYSLKDLVNENSRKQADALEAALRHHKVVEEFIQGKERKAMMKWLHAVSCEAAFDTITRERVPDSCQWFLDCEVYQAWKTADYMADLPEILWCHGGPGVGKTYLSAKIVENLRTTTSLPVCFFFASHTDERKREPLSLIGSWIYQLAVQRVSVFEKLKSTYNKRMDNMDITETELWDLFAFGIRASDGCYLLVDGFDEMTNEHGQARSGRVGAREALLRCLTEVLSDGAKDSRLHLAVISRQEPDIKRRISEAQGRNLATVRKHSIEPGENAQDLLSFCRRLVDEAVGDMEENFRLELAQKMADRSNGMMLWPYLISQELHPGRTEAQLLRDILESPRGLEHAYMRDLRRIEMLGPRMRERAVEILRWTLFALRPLSVSQITHALLVDAKAMSLDQEDVPGHMDEKYIEAQILGLCGSLVRYSPPQASNDAPEKGYVELAHFSVKEFLLGEANMSSIQFNERDSHGQLAAACLSYLTWEGFDDEGFRDQVSLPSRPDAEITAFYTHCTDEAGFFYYSHLWASHAKVSLSHASSFWYPIIWFLQICSPDRSEHNWWAYFVQDSSPEVVYPIKMALFEIFNVASVRAVKTAGFWSPPPDQLLGPWSPVWASMFIHACVSRVSATALFSRSDDALDMVSTVKNFWSRIFLVALIGFLDARRGRQRKIWPSPRLLVQMVRRSLSWPTTHGPSLVCPIALPLRAAATLCVHATLTLVGIEGIRWLTYSPTLSDIRSALVRDTAILLSMQVLGDSAWAVFDDSVRWTRGLVQHEFFYDHPDGAPFTTGDGFFYSIAFCLFQMLRLLYFAATLVYGKQDAPEAWVEWKDRRLIKD